MTTKQDWLKAGIDILVGEGAAGLSIDRLCQKLGVTKGSFYHHFKSQPDYQAKLIAFWQQEDTQQIVAALAALQGAPEGIDRLIQILGSRPNEAAHPELAIRAWALQDKTIRPAVEEIDTQRVRLMAELIANRAGDQDHAFHLARMLYAMLIGSYTIIPPIERDAVLDLYREFTRLYAI